MVMARRKGWLSDYYLAARDPKTGEFLELGKTFKGLTDAEIIEITKRLKESALSEDGHRVIVIPKIVVEVAYNEIQESPRYKSQMALRFARITRIRDDKTPEDASTIGQVREIYDRQFRNKGKYSVISGKWLRWMQQKKKRLLRSSTVAKPSSKNWVRKDSRNSLNPKLQLSAQAGLALFPHSTLRWLALATFV